MNGDAALSAQFGRRLDIQGLRAVAVLLVIAEHARIGLTGGFVGVDVFFVISGYVITVVLIKDFVECGRLRLSRFYVRRAYRLVPALALVCVVTAVLTALLLSPLGIQQQAALTGGTASLGLSNLALYFISSDYFSDQVQGNPFLHTWSLGVEEQFYLVFPLFLAAVLALSSKRIRRPVRVFVGLLAVLAGASFAISYHTSAGNALPGISSPETFAFYMMPARAWEFGTGASLAFASAWLSRSGRGHVVAGWAGIFLLLFSAFYINNSLYFPGVVALLPVAATGLIIYGGMKLNSASKLLGSQPLAHIGDISYSLYLWHWPLLVFARRLWPDNAWAVTAGVVLAFVLAELTYRLVEKRFQGRVSGFSFGALRIPVAGVLAAGLASTLLLGGSQSNWGSSTLRQTSEQLLARPAGYKECLSTITVSQRDLTPCTWGADRSGKPIYLVGDSNAQQFTEALIGASEQLNRPLVVATWGGCPFLDTGRIDLNDPTKGRECASYAQDGAAWIKGQKPGTIVMASAGTLISDPNIVLKTAEGVLLKDSEAKSGHWGDVMVSEILDLKSAGFGVLPVRTLPHFRSTTRDWWHPADCQNVVLFSVPGDCAATVSTKDMLREQKYIRMAEEHAVSLTKSAILDLTKEICTPDSCSTYSDGQWLYRDGLHISPAFSGALAGMFVDALEDAS